MRQCAWSDQGEALLRSLERRAAQAGQAPVAVLDADGTIWEDDLGEDALRALAAEGRLAAWAGEQPYATYEAAVERDRDVGYALGAAMLEGWEEGALRAWCQGFYQAHYAQKVFAAQKALVDRLQAAGWQVWVVSASPFWMVEAGARALGVPEGQILGIRVQVEQGRLTKNLHEPITSGEGKVAAIAQVIGRRPDLAVGNSMGDAPMMLHSQGQAIAINPSAELEALAARQGWHIELW